MKAQFQIVIPKRATFCAHCKQLFAVGQEIQSQLQEGEQEWLRQDSCTHCFSQIPHAVVWKQTINLKEKVDPENQDHIEKMLDLLGMLVASSDEEAHEEAFLLALYLVRKKVLAHRVKMGLYENLESGEMILIPKIDFAKFSAYAAQIRLQKKL